MRANWRALTALRRYQKQIRAPRDGRDEMVMMNTWGDRSQDTKVNERFCLEELERAARLGITHFQIDDGWQEGKSPNSALAKGSFRDIWANPDYWKPAADKYPSGLDPVVERARELGIEVGLWFNPSVQDDFAAWEKDADALLGLYRRYGIKVFKIDGLSIPTKRAETNLRRLFDRVEEESGGDVLFNLDATASRRGGYHMFNEYGNIFLENRYTDWGNYFPYRTLRNLWQLSRYVPAERIQVEFLNKWRNADKYAGDPFAPAGYGFDYLLRDDHGRAAAGMARIVEPSRGGLRHRTARPRIPGRCRRFPCGDHPARGRRAVGTFVDRIPVARLGCGGLSAALPRGCTVGRGRGRDLPARRREDHPDPRTRIRRPARPADRGPQGGAACVAACGKHLRTLQILA